MLILSRKPGDAIRIGENIRIVVLEADRQGVRIGIEAPAEVSILREEILEAIIRENQRANATAQSSEWVLKLAPKRDGS